MTGKIPPTGHWSGAGEVALARDRLGTKVGELDDPITRAVARSTITGLVRRLHPET